MRIVKQTLTYTAAAIFIFVGRKPVYSDFVKELGFSSGYTNNVTASVETRAKVSPKKTLVNRVKLGFGYNRKYGKRNYFYSIYRFNIVHYPDADYLRLRNHSLFMQFNNNLSKTAAINVSGQMSYYDFYNNPFITYSYAKLDLMLKKYLKYGLIFEGDYYFTFIDFQNPDTNSFSYGAIGNYSNNFSAKLKFWQTSTLRYSLQNITSLVLFDTSPSRELKWRSGLNSNKHRRDVYEAITAEITFVPVEKLLFNIGYLFEYNFSNSDYYNFRASSAIFDAVWSPDSWQQIILESRFGFFDYFNRTFDDRFQNTKKDMRLHLSASYKYRISENLKLITSYSFISNDSNDALVDFTLGHTKSYSSFTKNDIKADLKYTFN